MNQKGFHNFLLGPSFLFLGVFSWREDLLRIIRSESRSAGVFELLAQSFQGQECAQDGNVSMTAVFRKMAEEERRHAAVLQWFYRRRFGPLPSETEALTVDCKTVNQALCSGVHRLIQEKVAANRCASGPAWKRAMRMGGSFLRGVRQTSSPKPAPSEQKGFF